MDVSKSEEARKGQRPYALANDRPTQSEPSSHEGQTASVGIPTSEALPAEGAEGSAIPSIEELLVGHEPYTCMYVPRQAELQRAAKRLCWELNMSSPDDPELRRAIISRLFGGDAGARVAIEPPFHCDYGFNVHFHGGAFLNYGCVLLDTSPIEIGDGALLGPHVTLACAGHAICALQRRQGVETSAPISLGDDVWIGAGSIVCAGVSIGQGSVIGAGSVVTRDIPAGVVAVGNPCRVMRPVGERDRAEPLF